MKLISFVFSFKNEEKNLDELVKRVSNSMSKLNNYRYELIFVNDASNDGSEKRLENLQKNLEYHQIHHIGLKEGLILI